MKAATIKLFLVHGRPNGLRTAELSIWSGKAIAAPRTEISDLLKRGELSNPGFYLLTGIDPESGERVIYIGEAENVANRLRGHAVKDFWNSVTVFVSKDENLTKAHIRYLEGMLIDKANNNGSAIVMNFANSGAKLPESDAAEMMCFWRSASNFCLFLVLQILMRRWIKPVNQKNCSTAGSKGSLRKVKEPLMVL